MTFQVSKTPLVTKQGRESVPNPYLPFVEQAVKGTTYEDIMNEDDGKATVALLRRAAAKCEVGLAVKISEPNKDGKVKVLFKTQDRKARKPKATEDTAPDATAEAAEDVPEDVA